MKPEVSIVMPAIRPQHWDEVYLSIERSTKRSFELIIVSPYPLTPFLQDKRNVKYVKDYGSPMRASCIGAMLCEGTYVYPTHSDDSLFIDNSLDDNINFLISKGSDIRNVVVCKYSENQDLSLKNYQPDSYYKIVNAYPVNSNFISHDWFIFNAALWYREYFDTFGGWDCIYQACPMGHTDLAIRAQKAGAIVHLSPYPITDCSHMPGTSGDHAPIHYAQILSDEPIFRDRFDKPIDNLQTNIDIMNWKNADTVWKKRFK